MHLLENEQVLKFVENSEYEKSLVTKLFTILQNESVENIQRINPLYLSKKHNLNSKETTNILIKASRSGIFDLSWSLICPTCGAILIQNKSINNLNEESNFCSICSINVPVNLDDYVEVVFKFNPNVLPLSKYQMSFSSFFSQSFNRSESLEEYTNTNSLDFFFLESGKSKSIQFNGTENVLYRIIAINVNKCIEIHISSNNSINDNKYINISDKGFSSDKIMLKAGQIELELLNNCSEQIGFALVRTFSEKINKILKNDPPFFTPFLTGKDLLNNNVFRKLFKIDQLSTDLKLNLRSITLLFTDLKGSTNMYDLIGDISAYDLIQKHFKILSAIVEKYNGVIIKTMGDAIMAAFSNPEDGLLASIEMLEDIKSVNTKDIKSLNLKVGLHEGHALVINRDNHLDYFGQNVNIAARIQGIAGPDEIFISQSIFNFKEIKRVLFENKDKIKIYRRQTKLKGIGEHQVVYKLKYIK